MPVSLKHNAIKYPEVLFFRRGIFIQKLQKSCFR